MSVDKKTYTAMNKDVYESNINLINDLTKDPSDKQLMEITEDNLAEKSFKTKTYLCSNDNFKGETPKPDKEVKHVKFKVEPQKNENLNVTESKIPEQPKLNENNIVNNNQNVIKEDKRYVRFTYGNKDVEKVCSFFMYDDKIAEINSDVIFVNQHLRYIAEKAIDSANKQNDLLSNYKETFYNRINDFQQSGQTIAQNFSKAGNKYLETHYKILQRFILNFKDKLTSLGFNKEFYFLVYLIYNNRVSLAQSFINYLNLSFPLVLNHLEFDDYI